MAARWIPDPKVGGSNPSSLMFSQDVGDWSSGMILRLGRRGREFDSPITPLTLLACGRCTLPGQPQNKRACWFPPERPPSSDGRAQDF